eukprot:700681-Amphidinium_carterae.1
MSKLLNHEIDGERQASGSMRWQQSRVQGCQRCSQEAAVYRQSQTSCNNAADVGLSIQDDAIARLTSRFTFNPASYDPQSTSAFAKIHKHHFM